MKSTFFFILFLIFGPLTSWGQSATTPYNRLPPPDPQDLQKGMATTIVTVGDTIPAAVEEPPLPLCGMPAFYKTIRDEFKYPKEAKEKGITGMVFVEFLVNADGSLSDYRVIKGIGSGCDEEAVRILKESNKKCSWRPGKKDGVPIKKIFVVPIKFGVK